MRANWQRFKLEEHWNKHKECLTDSHILRVPCNTLEEYEARAPQILANAWICWKGKHYDCKKYEWRDTCIYVADDDMLLLIVNERTNEIKTCYHNHCAFPHGRLPYSGQELGAKRLDFNRKWAAICKNPKIFIYEGKPNGI